LTGQSTISRGKAVRQASRQVPADWLDSILAGGSRIRWARTRWRACPRRPTAHL